VVLGLIKYYNLQVINLNQKCLLYKSKSCLQILDIVHQVSIRIYQRLQLTYFDNMSKINQNQINKLLKSAAKIGNVTLV